MAVRAKWLGMVLVLIAGPALAQDQIEWQTDIAKAVQQAKDEKKLVLIHFYGDACAPCRAVEQKVFPDPKVVQSVMRNYVPVKINVNREEKIAARYAIRGIPTDVFLVGGTGQEAYRAVTKESAAEYATLLDYYAIQTGIGSGRQGVLRERESRYEPQPNQNAEQPPPAQQQYVQNQYATPSKVANNRYAPPAAAPAQPQVGEMPSAEARTAASGPSSAPGPSQPQVGPYGAEPAQPAGQPANVQGYAPQGGNRAQPAQPTMQRATFQDPGDITSRQPIRNQFIPLKDIPPIGMEGFCPVSVSPPGPGKEGVWRRGDRRFGAVHRGRTYLFASAEAQDKFLADPDAYSPVLSGADPVIFGETGQLVEGKRLIGDVITVNGRSEMYLFATPENRERFEKNQQHYSTLARQAMLKSETQPRLR